MKYLKFMMAIFVVLFMVGCSKGLKESVDDIQVEAIGLAWIVLSSDENIAVNSLVEVNLGDGNLTLIQDYSDDANLSNFLAGADMMGDKYIAIQYSSSKLYSFDIDGSYTMLADYSSLGQGDYWTGVAYDSSNNKLYLTTAYTIYELDPATYAIIDTIPISSGMTIGVACIANGTMYAVDIENDNLMTIDTTDGSVIVIGSLGFDANYAQDIAYDRINNKLYGTLYSDNGALYDINISSGAASIIGNFSEGQVEVAGFAITY